MNAQKSRDILLKKFDKLSGDYHYQNAEKIDYEQALWDGAEALEKQIPKKVVFGYDEQDDIFCPTCRFALATVDDHKYESKFYNYCPHCGVKLSWE